MKIIEGDLITLATNGKFDVIIHGCNCFCVMGAGLAKAIKDEFPEAYLADCATEIGDSSKLGYFTVSTVERGGHELTIVNAYTQYDFRGSGRKVDYTAVKAAFDFIRKKFSGKRIGYPMIGSGLAGGDWEIISQIIEESLQGEDHTLVVFKPNQH